MKNYFEIEGASEPTLEMRAPNRRFTEEQVAEVEKNTGVKSVERLDQSDDGTFGAVRIIFESNKYLDGYTRILKKKVRTLMLTTEDELAIASSSL